MRDHSEKLEPARGRPEIFEAIRKANAKKFRGFEAWLKAIELVKNAVDLPFDEGVARSARCSWRCSPRRNPRRSGMCSSPSVRRRRSPTSARTSRQGAIRSVGVIGAGTMGGGIAMNFLSAGIPVTIVETSKEALDRGVSIMRRNYESTARKGRITMAEVEERMGRLDADPRLQRALCRPIS